MAKREVVLVRYVLESMFDAFDIFNSLGLDHV